MKRNLLWAIGLMAVAVAGCTKDVPSGPAADPGPGGGGGGGAVQGAAGFLDANRVFHVLNERGEIVGSRNSPFGIQAGAVSPSSGLVAHHELARRSLFTVDTNGANPTVAVGYDGCKVMDSAESVVAMMCGTSLRVLRAGVQIFDSTVGVDSHVSVTPTHFAYSVGDTVAVVAYTPVALDRLANVTPVEGTPVASLHLGANHMVVRLVGAVAHVYSLPAPGADPIYYGEQANVTDAKMGASKVVLLHNTGDLRIFVPEDAVAGGRDAHLNRFYQTDGNFLADLQREAVAAFNNANGFSHRLIAAMPNLRGAGALNVGGVFARTRLVTSPEASLLVAFATIEAAAGVQAAAAGAALDATVARITATMRAADVTRIRRALKVVHRALTAGAVQANGITLNVAAREIAQVIHAAHGPNLASADAILAAVGASVAAGGDAAAVQVAAQAARDGQGVHPSAELEQLNLTAYILSLPAAHQTAALDIYVPHAHSGQFEGIEVNDRLALGKANDGHYYAFDLEAALPASPVVWDTAADAVYDQAVISDHATDKVLFRVAGMGGFVVKDQAGGALVHQIAPGAQALEAHLSGDTLAYRTATQNVFAVDLTAGNVGAPLWESMAHEAAGSIRSGFTLFTDAGALKMAFLNQGTSDLHLTQTDGTPIWSSTTAEAGVLGEVQSFDLSDQRLALVTNRGRLFVRNTNGSTWSTVTSGLAGVIFDQVSLAGDRLVGRSTDGNAYILDAATGVPATDATTTNVLDTTAGALRTVGLVIPMGSVQHVEGSRSTIALQFARGARSELAVFGEGETAVWATEDLAAPVNVTGFSLSNGVVVVKQGTQAVGYRLADKTRVFDSTALGEISSAQVSTQRVAVLTDTQNVHLVDFAGMEIFSTTAGIAGALAGTVDQVQLSDGMLLITSAGNLYAYNPADGAPLWDTTTHATVANVRSASLSSARF